MQQPEPDALVGALAAFVVGASYDDLDEANRTATRKLLIDALGTGVGGSQEDGCRELRALAQDLGGKPEATVLGTGVRVPANLAAAVNSAMTRALELDDVSERGLMHTTATVVPAAIAAAQAADRPVTGRELLAAVAVGIEIGNRLSWAALAPPERPKGPRVMSTTYQIGTYAAAAVAAKLWGLDEAGVVRAMGLAHGQVSGGQQGIYDSSLAVRVQQGLTTQNGVFAAQLAAAGVTGPTRFLEGTAGYYNMFWGGLYHRDEILDGLGSVFTADQVSIKPYPCCKFTHTAVTAAMEIFEERPVVAEEVERVDAPVPSREYFNLVCDPVAEKQKPQNLVDAQFSLPYSVAVALHGGRPRIGSFNWPGLGDEAVLALAQKVHPELVELEEEQLPAPGEVTVRFTDGQAITRRCEAAPGHPANPMSWEQLGEKFRGLAAHPTSAPLPAEQADAVLAAGPSFEEIADVDAWVSEHLAW